MAPPYPNPRDELTVPRRSFRSRRRPISPLTVRMHGGLGPDPAVRSARRSRQGASPRPVVVFRDVRWRPEADDDDQEQDKKFDDDDDDKGSSDGKRSEEGESRAGEQTVTTAAAAAAAAAAGGQNPRVGGAGHGEEGRRSPAVSDEGGEGEEDGYATDQATQGSSYLGAGSSSDSDNLDLEDETGSYSDADTNSIVEAYGGGEFIFTPYGTLRRRHRNRAVEMATKVKEWYVRKRMERREKPAPAAFVNFKERVKKSLSRITGRGGGGDDDGDGGTEDDGGNKDDNTEPSGPVINATQPPSSPDNDYGDVRIHETAEGAREYELRVMASCTMNHQ